MGSILRMYLNINKGIVKRNEMIHYLFKILITFTVYQFTSFTFYANEGFTLQNGTCEVINAGVSGNSTKDLLKRVEKDVVDKKPDLVILMVGTNDMLNSRKLIPFSTYHQNLESIVKTISSNGAKVLLMSPPTADSTYLFERHPKSAFPISPNDKLDTISRIIEAISISEDQYFLNIFGIFQSMHIPVHDQDEYIRNINNSGARDGVHPTEMGYQLIADSVFSFLLENKLLDNTHQIICFGDSITKGGQKNIKTSLPSNTYPAILQMKIEEYMIQNKK